MTPEDQHSTATTRATSFGSAAEAYERFRPGYSGDLVDAVLGYAGRPVRTALEIGAGTGKATRAFAARGIAITATDPDAAMLAELRRHVPDSVTTSTTRFEDIATDRTYDLVFAAAAMHWTEPVGRWPHVAALLEPAGTFASFGGTSDLADADLEAAVQQARSSDMPEDRIPSPDGTGPDEPMQWPGTELIGSGLFTDVMQLVIERRHSMSADDYLGILTTVSAYLMLPAATLTDVLARIRAVLPETVDVNSDLYVHLARKV